MPPRMNFRQSHTGDLNAEQPQNLSAPPTADASAKAGPKAGRILPDKALQKFQAKSMDDPLSDFTDNVKMPKANTQVKDCIEIFNEFIETCPISIHIKLR